MAHASPFKTITDPGLIQKKNELRKAVSEEYIKQTSNPYRNIKMEGGTLVCIYQIFLEYYYIVFLYIYSLMLVFKDICL